MRGMGGIVESIGSLFAAVGIDLPPWGLPVIVLAVMGVLLPRIYKTMETSRIRRIIQRSRGEADEQRIAMEQEALRMAGDDPHRLVAVADEALRARRAPLAEEALSRLVDTGELKDHVKRLRKELRPKDPLPKGPVEAALVLERLVESGMLDEARRRQARFEKRWPRHPDLERAAAALRAAER